MVGADFALAEPFGQLMRHALHQTARVDENQRRAMGFDLLNKLVVDRLPNILANDRSKLVIRNFNAEFHLAPVTDVDDGAIRRAVIGNPPVSNQ